jgi:cytochrome c biogenesis protein CcmG/thiol:disulfide interchange protein DsbE
MPMMASRRARSLCRPIAIVAVSMLAAACSHAPPAPGGAAEGPRAQNAATAALLPTRVASLPTFDTDAFTRLLAQLHGTPVVVNVWASWCVPCKAEAPLLRAASRTFGTRVQFLGIDVLDSLDGARAFIADERMSYPSVFDPSGAIRNALGQVGQPATVFYDASGTIVSSWPGQITQQVLDAGIRKAMS